MTSADKLRQLHHRLTTTVLGSEQAATLLLVALLAKGHALIEGAPGIGKTSLAQTLAESMGGVFKRIQFTPDLLPSDILGYHLYRQHSGDFDFVEGPVFAHMLLADEINRTSPRVQSALLEAMNEGQVTIDGATRKLEEPFLVIATQNDTTSTGTFPLPEPQLDRFLLSIPMELPERSVQESILMLHSAQNGSRIPHEPLLSTEEILSFQQMTTQVHVSEQLAAYIVALCEQVRRLAGGDHTVSVRGSLCLLRAGQARALLDGKSHVLPDHVQDVFTHVLRHRVICEDGGDAETVLQSALEQTAMA